MFPFERYEKIVELLKEEGTLTITQLCDTLGVSVSTIRNDLNKLEADGILTKIHGGAKINAPEEQPASFNERLNQCLEEKEAIGSQAINYIQNNQQIFLDASSTVLPLANLLKQKHHVTVITNGLITALETKDISSIETVLTGGVVNSGGYSLSGLLSQEMIDTMNFDVAFFSAEGFTLEHGVTTYSLGEANLKRELIRRSKTKIALLDHTKLEAISAVNFCKTDDIDIIITDEGADEAVVASYRDAGIEVIVAPL